jgi:hypothetical protein
LKPEEIVIERARSYGPPGDFWPACEAIWLIMDAMKGPRLVPGVHTNLKMIVMKALRLCYTPDHKDSLDDIVGYKICIEECLRKMNDKAK